MWALVYTFDWLHRVKIYENFIYNHVIFSSQNMHNETNKAVA